MKAIRLLRTVLFSTAFFGGTVVPLCAQISLVNEGRAHYQMAELYRSGDRFTQSYEKAFDCYKRACEADEPMAFRLLGHLYMTGKGVQKDEAVAWKYYTEAKRHGAFPEQDFAEEWALKELETPQPLDCFDQEKTMDEWMKEGEMRRVEYALNYGKGVGIFACASYMTPARYGNPKAQYWVGKYYAECANPKKAGEYRDAILNAKKWLARSAAQGNEDAKKLLSELPQAEPANAMSVEEARGLYSLLENIKGQKSLFAEEVNAKNVKKLLASKYLDAISSVDEEKNVIAFNNNSIYITFEPERQLICLVSYVVPAKKLDKNECVDIANGWNQKQIFLIMCYDEDAFRAEYYLSYAGGIHADNLNASLDYYFRILGNFAGALKDYCAD
ncbi:MAG: hypothetical protein J6V90_13000 [Treponema sp.]|nr:hypothetical protein [Treponema sp.]